MEKVKEAIGKVTGHPKLPTAKLGKNGPQVTRVGYGTMGLSAFYGQPKPDEERFKVLDKVYDEGDLFWDTADMYQDSEDLLGKWFKLNPGKRELPPDATWSGLLEGVPLPYPIRRVVAATFVRRIRKALPTSH